MKLFFSPASPYVRKVMASAHHLGIADRITLLDSAASPVAMDERIARHNPTGKVPTMLLDDGGVLIDSRTICEYLDSLRPDAGLFPKGAVRWEAMRVHAVADGLLDAALLARYETAIRPEDLRWDDWLAGSMRKIDACLAALEEGIASLEAPIHVGTITAGCALGYLDFRFAHHHWRETAPQLAAWWAQFRETPPMAKTAPRQP